MSGRAVAVPSRSQPAADGRTTYLAGGTVRRTEDRAQLRLGKTITYLLRHWKGLTPFLREARASPDNNLVTPARETDDIMPPPELCRVVRVLAQPTWFLTVPDAA
jgi:Transposase IS66 family